MKRWLRLDGREAGERTLRGRRGRPGREAGERQVLARHRPPVDRPVGLVDDAPRLLVIVIIVVVVVVSPVEKLSEDGVQLGEEGELVVVVVEVTDGGGDAVSELFVREGARGVELMADDHVGILSRILILVLILILLTDIKVKVRTRRSKNFIGKKRSLFTD